MMVKDNITCQATGYRKELNRQCKVLVFPAALTGLLSWLPYISLDKSIYPDIPALIYFRLGFSLVGLIAIVLSLFPFFKNRSYPILFSVTCYVVAATGIIVGLVGADPAYMGGFSMIVILMAFLPFQRGHALALIFASGVLFLIAAFFTNVDLELASKQYGLLNLIMTFVMSVAIVFLIDYTRKTSFERGLLIRRRNKEIEKQKIELEEAMTKLKTLGGLLPICANCKSIRDSKGYWHQLERYIGDHSEAEFSHSLCEDCVKKLYPDLADHLYK